MVTNRRTETRVRDITQKKMEIIFLNLVSALLFVTITTLCGWLVKLAPPTFFKSKIKSNCDLHAHVFPP